MRMLGAHGSKSENSQLSSYLLDENTVIDAGNLIQSLGDNFLKLDNIIITHAHFDHIADLPIALDAYYSRIKKSINIFATQAVITILKEHIFNNKVWPDFSRIPLMNSNQPTIVFNEIKYFKEYAIGNFTIKPYPNFHTFGSCGFIINNCMVFTSDTALCYFTWKLLNEDKNLKKLIIEVSFPSVFKKLAVMSRHLTPVLLKDELKSLERDDVQIYINHIKYEYKDKIVSELKEIGLYDKVTILDDNDEIELG